MTDKAERKWIWLYALLVMAITSVPYAIGFLLQDDHWRYTGFVFGVEDGNSYIAKMLSGAYGAWLFRTPYTTHPQQGVLAYFPYLALGRVSLAGLRHTSLIAWFQVFRWAGGLLMVHGTYDFVSIFLKNISSRRYATVMATAGGGLGWLVVFGLDGIWQNGLPLEFYSPETFGFMSLYGLPHLACARGFLMWGLAKYLTSGDHPWREGFITGFLWLLLGTMQPMTVLLGGAVIGVHLLLTGIGWITRRADLQSQWKLQFQYALGMGILSAPLIGYTTILFLTDPFLKVWSAQNILPSPPILDYLLAYGGMLLLAVFGAKSVLQHSDKNRWLMILGWIALFPILAYAPVNVQRRLVEGVWVAMVVLAFAAIETYKPGLQRIIRYGLLISLLPGLILIAGGVGTVMQLRTPLYRPASEVAVFEYLEKNANVNEVVLASYETSNPLPAWAPLRTMIGHGPESFQLDKVKDRVELFFHSSTNDEERLELLGEFQVRYVFWGPNERDLGSWQPSQADYLQAWYEKDGYQVFRVVE